MQAISFNANVSYSRLEVKLSSNKIKNNPEVEKELKGSPYKNLIESTHEQKQIGSTEYVFNYANEQLEILYESYKTEINAALKKDETAQTKNPYGILNQLYEEFTPEKVSQRILDFALPYFHFYQKNHPNDSFEDQVNGFAKLIGGAVQTGYNKAAKILDGFIDAQAKSEIESTLKLTMDGIETWRQNQLNTETAKDEVA